MHKSLRTKLIMSYVLAAIVIVLLINALTNIYVEKHFREYVSENQQLKNREIVSTLASQYRGDGIWNTESIASIGEGYLESGIIIVVKDLDGQTIWDAKQHNNGMCQRIIEHMASNSGGMSGNMDSGYKEIPYSLNYRLNKVGVVEIGTYGPNYLNEHDQAFINAFNTVMLGVGVFSLFFAFVLGRYMANRLSSPISKVIAAARSISKGYYSERITQKSNMSEINELTSTINNLAESLEKQEELRKRLTGDVAHELRTPLATLQSHIEAMIDGIWEADKERLISCHEEITRISKMVGDLEKLTKYENETLKLEKEVFDISELSKRLIQNFESQFLSKKIDISFEGSAIKISADKDKISQVIVNLLSNALKYTPDGGNVYLGAAQVEDKITLIVRDNGPGISQSDLPFIFERFYRADKSRNRITGGVGIGLSISKAIVNAHGGTIMVQSTPESGSEFIVILPKE